MICQHNSLRRSCPICERDDEIAELRAVLAELVACRDLHARADLGADEPDAMSDVEWRSLRQEYATRSPLAWAAARKELEP